MAAESYACVMGHLLRPPSIIECKLPETSPPLVPSRHLATAAAVHQRRLCMPPATTSVSAVM